MSKTKYRDIYDPVEEIIGRFLSGVGNHPSEDDLISAIDHKYANIHWEVLYLKRQGYKPEQIMKILNIGEMSYQRAIDTLQSGGHWKEYKKHGKP
jgi:hypothetical protein